MPFATPRGAIAACVGLLLVAALWTGTRVNSVDPRARAAWLASGPITVGTAPVEFDVFLPGCAIDAVLVHAVENTAGSLHAAVSVMGATGASPATPVTPGGHGGLTVDAHGRFRVPVPTVPWRQAVRLRLSSLDKPIVLRQEQPLTLERAHPSALGLLPCAFDESVASTALTITFVMIGLVGAGWLAGHLWAGTAPLVSHVAGARVAAILTASTALVYLMVVPPFEPPDELAHFQYARFVAVTGTLPHEVPDPGSEWRSSSYEWVQQPLYYLAAAGVLRTFSLHEPAPAPRVNPRSRLTGGHEVAIFAHDGTRGPHQPIRGLYLLRLLSVAMAAGTAWCAARATTLATGSPWLGALAGSSLALVPQWAAVVGIVSTDPPATLAAALVTLLLCRACSGYDTAGLWPGAGLLVGVAYAVKATAVFLVPMAFAAAWTTSRGNMSTFARRAAWLAGGLALTAAWLPIRAWLVFGDPLARQFKRGVLEAGGFVVVEGPPVFSRAFADQWRTMVFEPFWARFGSLGAGPLPGTRLWWLYGAASVVLTGALIAGIWTAYASRDTSRRRVLRIMAAGVIVGLGLWLWVNLVPQADVVVHWTPRHILPLTAPLLVLVAAGVQWVSQRLSGSAGTLLHKAAAVGVLSLALASLAVLRSVILGFHFGF